MGRHDHAPMPLLDQPAFLTPHDIDRLLGQMKEHPRELNIDGHQPLTSAHLVDGYIATLAEHGLLDAVRNVVISHAEFNGLLLANLARLPSIRRLELVVCAIDGPIDLRPVPVVRVVLVDNDIEVPHRGSSYLALSPQTRRIKLFGKNIRNAEIRRLRSKYRGLKVTRENRG